MKKYFLFFALFFYSLSYLQAQFEFMQFENASYNLKRNYFSSNTLKNNHVKSCTIKKIIGNEYLKFNEYSYNSEARVISRNIFSKSGKKRYMHLYKYLNDTLITNFTVLNRKADTSSWIIYNYDNKYRLIRAEDRYSCFLIADQFWKYQYNNMNKLSAYSQIDKNGKDNYRYEYDFYDNGTRKETRYFNKKNKLKYRWTYECDQKGVLASNAVKQGNFCTKKELHNDGTFMEVFDYTNEKGKHIKTVCYYTKDSLLTLYEEYNAKGKLKYKWEYVYDKKGNATQILYYNSKELKRKFMYAYNEKDLCVKMDFYNKKGKLNNSFIYDYNYSN